MSDAKRITIDDIEQKLRSVTAPVESGVGQARSLAPAVGLAIGAVIVVAAYVLGRRRGKRRTPVIEIRRI